MKVAIENLKPLSEAIKEEAKKRDEQIQYWIKSAAEDYAETTARLEENRLALQLLAPLALDAEITSNYTNPGKWLYVELGIGYDRKGRTTNHDRVQDALRMIAATLQGHWEEPSKEVSNGRKGEIRVSLRHSKFKGVVVKYYDRIGKEPSEKPQRCKLVRQVENTRRVRYSLECQNT